MCYDRSSFLHLEEIEKDISFIETAKYIQLIRMQRCNEACSNCLLVDIRIKNFLQSGKLYKVICPFCKKEEYMSLFEIAKMYHMQTIPYQTKHSLIVYEMLLLSGLVQLKVILKEEDEKEKIKNVVVVAETPSDEAIKFLLYVENNKKRGVETYWTFSSLLKTLRLSNAPITCYTHVAGLNNCLSLHPEKKAIQELLKITIM